METIGTADAVVTEAATQQASQDAEDVVATKSETQSDSAVAGESRVKVSCHSSMHER